jgi:hypothetical protein
MNDTVKSPEKLAGMFKAVLLPILLFAPVNAIICWSAAWVFRDRYEIMAVFVGFGCVPIVVALCAYLYVLINTVGRG